MCLEHASSLVWQGVGFLCRAIHSQQTQEEEEDNCGLACQLVLPSIKYLLAYMQLYTLVTRQKEN